MPTEQPNENVSNSVGNLNEQPKEALTLEELRRQKRREYEREYMREYCKKNREKWIAQAHEYYLRSKEKRNRESRERYQKNHEKILAEKRERYRSDPEFRKMQMEADRKHHLKLREEYKRFKIELGGKCVVCGNDNLNHLIPHHIHGRREKGREFIFTKEFRDWMRGKCKPDVILMCSNHHLEYETMKSRGEVANIADFLKLKNNFNK